MTKCIIYSKPPVLFYNKRPSVLWFYWGFLWWPESLITWQMVWEELVFLKVSRQRCFNTHSFSSSSTTTSRWGSWKQHFNVIFSAFLNYTRSMESWYIGETLYGNLDYIFSWLSFAQRTAETENVTDPTLNHNCHDRSTTLTLESSMQALPLLNK